MADHKTLQIRDRIVTTVTGLVTTGTDVFAARVYPLQESDLPALTVKIGASESETHNMGNRDVLFKTEFIITAHVQDISDVDAALLLIAKEVGVALGSDLDETSNPPWLNGLATAFYPAEEPLSEPESSGEGKKPIATMEIKWAAEYVTAINNWE